MVQINFSKKELDSQRLEVSHILRCYLIAIADKNPNLFKQLLELILETTAYVEKGVQE